MSKDYRCPICHHQVAIKAMHPGYGWEIVCPNCELLRAEYPMEKGNLKSPVAILENFREYCDHIKSQAHRRLIMKPTIAFDMFDDETQDEAEDRMLNKCDQIGVSVLEWMDNETHIDEDWSD